MKHKKLISIKNPVIKIKIVNSGKIYVLDINNTLRIFDEEFKLKGGFKIKLPPHKLYENTADISVSGKYLAIVNKKKTIIYEVAKKSIKYQFRWHRGDVLLCSFDNEENYLLTGGSDSRAYIWSLRLGKMFLSLPPHPDYILSGGFSKNNLWVATGSYDRLITITNIASPNLNYRKKSHRGAVSKIKFFSKNIMITGDKTGEIIKWDYRKATILKRFNNMNDMVVDFDTDSNEEYLFAITKEKKVYLYDFNTGEILSQEFIKLNSFPTTIVYNKLNDNLYIGCTDGSLYIFDLLEQKTTLKEAIEKKDYSKAYELIKENPILKRTNEYKELENIWEKTLNKIYELLEKGEIDKAKKLFEPFSGVSFKRTLFQNLLMDYGDFEKFKNAVINKRYPLAYSLVKHHPSYKDSIYYKQLEKDFKLRFNKARELIKLSKVEEAKEILKPFRGVSEKAMLIQSLFKEKKLYDLLKQKLQKRDFKEFFDLISKHPFLIDTPEYEMAMKYAKEIEKKAKEAIKNGDYKIAMRLANILKDFPKYKAEAEEIMNEAKNISTFLMYIANNNFDMVEKMVNKYPYLEELKDYQQFLEKYKNIIKKAEEYSINGDVKSIKEYFKDLAKSETFKSLVFSLIKRAYLKQIMKLLQENSPKLNKAIQNYINLFGADNEIKDLIKIASKKQNITINNYEKSLDISLEELPDSITEL